MLYNGEQIGDGSPPAGRHRRRPARGHDADARRACRTRCAVIALSERGSMFDPGPCVYMEKMAGGARDRRPARPRPADRRDARARSPSARASTSRDVMVVVLDRPRHEDGIHDDPRRGRARAAHLRRRRLGRAARGHRATRRSTCCGASAARPRASSPRRAQVHGRPARRPAVAARRRASARPRSTRATTSSASSPHDDLVTLATTASSPPPASPTATSSRACATSGARGGDDRVAGHALALGHRAPRPRPPRPREAARGHRRALRLGAPGGSRRRSARARGPGPAASSIVARSARPRLGEVEPRERAQEAVGDDDVDARLRVRVEPAADPRARSPDRSSRPRPRRGAMPCPGRRDGRSAGRRSRGSRRRRGPAARRGRPSRCASGRCRARRPSRTRAPGTSAAG